MNDETIGNQQEMPTLDELGWFAGILEGEGSISMNVRRKKWNGWNGIGVDLHLQVVNSDSAIIKKAKDILLKLGIEPHLYERENVPIYKKDGNCYHNPTKTLISLSISKMSKIHSILTLIEPFMAGEKKTRASLIREFIDRRLSRKGDQTVDGPSWYDAYDWGLVNKFYEINGGKLLPEVRQFLNDHMRTAQQCDDMV